MSYNVARLIDQTSEMGMVNTKKVVRKWNGVNVITPGSEKSPFGSSKGAAAVKLSHLKGRADKQQHLHFHL